MLKLFFLKTFIALCLFSFTDGNPRKLVIIRNAEAAPKGDTLNAKGRQRAAALAYLIYEQFGYPISIHTTNPNSEFDSIKPYETLLPLSEYAQSPILSFYTKSQLNLLLKSIIDESTNDNKVVIIGLTNDLIPQVTQYFKITQAPLTWNEDIYDRIWVINFNDDGNLTFENKPQALLFGDTQS